MDFLLKQRLVGAIVLVALAVIFIPMLLEGPGRTLVPEMDAVPTPIDVAPPKPLSRFPSATEVPTVPPVSVDQTESSEPVGEEIVRPSAPPPAPSSDAAPVPTDGWVVQMGSFSNRQNALALRDRLRDGDFTTQVERVEVGGISHYRVRVGPFLVRDDAEKAQAELAKRHQLKGRVLSYP